MTAITARRQMNMAESSEALCVQTVEQILLLSKKAIGDKGRFDLVLSGGSTPQAVYALMAQSPYREQFDWNKIFFFFGDERWVPWNNPRSNYKMAMDALLAKVGLASGHVFGIRTDVADAAVSAALYEKDIIQHFKLKPNEFPRFDLILLGLGQDGHTASLFPNQPSLHEQKHLAVATQMPETSEKRITLTLPVINHAKNIIFLVSGKDKAEILKKAWGTDRDGFLPAQKVNPDQGQLWWFVDKEAASTVCKEDSKKKQYFL